MPTATERSPWPPGFSLVIIAAKSLIGFTGDLRGDEVIDWDFLLLFTAIAIGGIIAGSATLSFLQLAPADNLRVLRQDGFYLNSGAAWVDDPITGITYYAIGGTRFPILRAEGPPVRLWPGKTNFLRLLMQEQGSHNTGRQFTITAAYHPRRLAL